MSAWRYQHDGGLAALVDRERWVAGLILAESRPVRTRSRIMVDRIERTLAGLDRLEAPDQRRRGFPSPAFGSLGECLFHSRKPPFGEVFGQNLR